MAITFNDPINGKLNILMVGVLLYAISNMAEAANLTLQRQLYSQAEKALDKKKPELVTPLLTGLKGYPLYPYIEYRLLTQDMSQLTYQQVDQFTKHYPDLAITHTLNNRMLNELIVRNDWNGYLRYSPQPPKSIAGRCNYYFAKYSTGHQTEAFNEIDTLWRNEWVLPASCNKLVSAWQKSGKQSNTAKLQRILLASEKGGKEANKQIKTLVDSLSNQNKLLAKDVVALFSAPEDLLVFSQKHHGTNYTQQVSQRAFRLLARKQPELAQKIIPDLVRKQNFTEQQARSLERTLCWQLMSPTISTELTTWRDKVIASSANDSLIERRIRLALNQAEHKQIDFWLAKLSSEVAKKEEWRYWHADSLINKGNKKQGEAILAHLAQQRGFYPMVSAQRLGVPYKVSAKKVINNGAHWKDDLTVRRVVELRYWNKEEQARREWLQLLSQHSRSEQEELARYAFDHNWPDLTVQATISAKLWNHLEERFPVAYPELFKRAVEDKKISLGFAMAITRQESAWNSRASSPAGARGLMQLIPKTAKEIANKVGITDYKRTEQLFDPNMNIELGTSYLDYVYQMFDQNRILAAAAYNAGPHRVTNWLINSSGKINAVAFIESIPFTETRSYVKNVLSYNVFYDHFMSKSNKVLTDKEWQQIY